MITLLNLLVERLNFHNSILVFSVLFLFIALLCYFYGKNKLSYFFFYISLTYLYFFIMLTFDISPIIITYEYYFLSFLSYHFCFTFSRLFCLRTIVVTRGYLKNNESTKFVLWIFFVFILTLFGDSFIMLAVFNPLLLFSFATSNFIVAFFLILIWSWMFILIFCNKLGIFIEFLYSIQGYFSRRACLHFIGNQPGKYACQKVGAAIVCTPILVSIPALGGYALDKESQTANYAISQMENYKIQNPNCSYEEQYNVYNRSYTAHANSSIVGRQLTKWGVMQPAAPEAVILEYSTGLQDSLDGIINNKKP